MRIIRLLTGCLANLFAHQHVIAKQNCFWEIVVRRLQEQDIPQRLPLDCFGEIVVGRLYDAHSMASTHPYAGGKEYFALLTVYLWLSKSNPGLLKLADWSIRTLVNSLACLLVPLANLST